MKLLLDQNVSHRVLARLSDVFQGSVHVRDVLLSRGTDEAVWQHAKDNGLILVSKDCDFQQRSLLRGHPPKVIWLRVGNCTNDAICDLINHHVLDIQQFADDETSSFLVLS